MISYDERVAGIPLLFILFILFIFLYLQFTVNKWDGVLFRYDSRRSCFNERGAATPWQTDTSKHVWRLSELVGTMQHVVRVDQGTAMCHSMCSEPLSSMSATTRMFTVLLSGRFCLQNLLGSRRRPCSLLCGLAWLGLAWLGLAWLGLAWLGLAWLGLAWLGLAWLGLAWLGLAWLGLAWLGLAWLGLAWLAWLGLAWLGLAWLGLAFLLMGSPFLPGVWPFLLRASRCWPFLLGVWPLLLRCFLLGVWPFLIRVWPFLLGGWAFLRLALSIGVWLLLLWVCFPLSAVWLWVALSWGLALPSFCGFALPSFLGVDPLSGLALPSLALALPSQGWPLLRGWPFLLKRLPILLGFLFLGVWP